ncbi:MAG: hypothetical protein AB7F88_10645 [Pyrinomonadaceae bacterium]
MICVDNNFLVLLFFPGVPARPDPSTGKPTEQLQERLKLLQDNWQTNHETILLADPALCEFLILAYADRTTYLRQFQNSPNYEIRPFDTRAAIELASMYNVEKKTLTGKKLAAFNSVDTKTRLKFDRQIIAIAKANNIKTIYSDDNGVKTFGEFHGLEVIRSFELPLPEPPPPSLFDFLPEDDSLESEKDNEGKADNIVPIGVHRSSGVGAPSESADGNGKAEIEGAAGAVEVPVTKEEQPKATSESGLVTDDS